MLNEFFNGSTGETGYAIQRSLRFNSADSAHLSRTPSSAGNRKTWTWSGWVKRSQQQQVYQSLFTAGSNNFIFRFQNDTLYYYDYNGSTFDANLGTAAVYRDQSAWMHIVFVYDSTNATNTDRLRFYVNGSRITQFDSGSETYPPLNTDSYCNNNTEHRIGGDAAYGARRFDGYLADVHFIDGQALAPTDFGKYDDNNVWQPIEYAGTYGTNGFHLDFSDNSSNAALGYDAAGSNDWTVNNLTAENPTSLPAVSLSSTDYLTIPDSDDTDFGTGDFTWEGWFYIRATGDQGLYGSSTSGEIGIRRFGDNKLGISRNNVAIDQKSASDISNNVWTHLVIQRSGTTLKMFIDGAEDVSVINSQTYDVTAPNIGTTNGVDGDFIVSNFRLVKGTAVYSGNFTPSTDLQNVTNTVLLCCKSSTSATAAVVTPGTITETSGATATTFSDSTSANDSLIDTPTNYEASSGNNGGNYATLNPLDQSPSTGVLSNGNLDYAYGLTALYAGTRGTIGVSSGKWYYECAVSTVSPTFPTYIGVATQGFNYEAASNIAIYGDETRYYGSNGTKSTSNGTQTTATYGSTYTTGDLIGVALDLDAGTITFYKNGVSQGQAYSGLSGTYFPALVTLEGGDLSANFGQRPFAYTPPTGFKSLCTTNLTDPTIADGSTAMDVALYTGNGTSQSITSINHAPDFVWIKNRSSSGSHGLFDAVRGAGERLRSDTTGAEQTQSTTLTSFDSNGFSLGSGYNTSSTSYVAWAWDAGTTTVSNTDGTITSSVRANPTTGFSIVSYVGTQAIGTVGHGLNATPQMFIVKSRDTSFTGDWRTYHIGIDDPQRYLKLHSTAASAAGSSTWNSTDPTSSVFTLGSGLTVNTSGDNYIAYCFAPVEGYSAFGSYISNGIDEGPWIYTGMRPRLIMIKRVDSPGNWLIYDTARDPVNEAVSRLFPNLADKEETATKNRLDIFSNGFKPAKVDNDHNFGSGTYIYAAFAERPFKYARAR